MSAVHLVRSIITMGMMPIMTDMILIFDGHSEIYEFLD